MSPRRRGAPPFTSISGPIAPRGEEEHGASSEWEATSSALGNHCHYWSLRDKLTKGRLSESGTRTWRDRLAVVKERFIEALGRPPGP